MDVSKVLAELAAERTQIEEAILNLERLASGRGRGPGKPPKRPRRSASGMADDDMAKRRIEEALRSLEELARGLDPEKDPETPRAWMLPTKPTPPSPAAPAACTVRVPRRNPPGEKKPH